MNPREDILEPMQKRYLFFHFSIFLQAKFVISILLLFNVSVINSKFTNVLPPNRFAHKEDIFVLTKKKSITFRKDTNDVTTGHLYREISMIDISRGFKQVSLHDNFAQTA